MATTKRKSPGNAKAPAVTGKGDHTRTRRTLRTHPRAAAFAVGAAFAPWFLGSAFADPAANQLPTGGQIGAGSVTISTAGTKMQIDQASDKAIVNWNCFCIGSNAWVNFNQPSASSVILNRSTQAAEIFGRMSANGQVFVTSGAGVYFGRTAQVDVGSLLASSLTITDQNFLAGKYIFSKDGSAGEVVNEGTIVAVGGYAALAGTQVRNNGIIIAQAGTVALAAGDRVSLDMIGDGLVRVSVDAAALNALALNAGTIVADGGRVVLTARSANALLDTVINNTGVIRARSLVARAGEIILDGGDAGIVANSGTLDASGTSAGQTGGTVKVLGQYAGLFGGTRIDVSGDAGGGNVFVGGNFHGDGPEQNATATYVARDASINADAVTSGNGGNVAIWSDNTTRFFGTITARGGAQGGDGGFVEVSGKKNLAFDGLVLVGAPKGRAGTLLLDPDDLYLGQDPGGGALDAAAVPDDPVTAFSANNGSDDFFVSNGSIIAAGDAHFIFHADNNVIFNAPITAGNTGGNTFDVSANGSITMGGNSLTTAGGGVNFTAASMSLSDITTSGGAISATATAGSLTSAGTLSTSGGGVTLSASSMSLAAIDAGAGAISATASGTIDLTGTLTSSASGNAVTVTSTADEVTVSGGSISVSSGIGRIFTGAVANPNLTALIVSGSGKFRYNGNTSNFSNGNVYAIYREQPFLTVTPDNASKFYGADDPAQSYFSVTGYVNGDSAGLTGAYVRAVGENVATSPYAITQGTVASSVGYGITFVAGQTLTINPVGSLTAQVTSQSKVYGNDDPAVAGVPVTLAGFVNRTVSTWNGGVPVNDSGVTTTAISLARDAGETVTAPGPAYAITGGTFNVPNTNYTAPSFDGANLPTLTITKATVGGQLTTPGQTKSYGADDPSIAGIAITATTGLVSTTVTDWNSNGTLIADTSANVTLTLASLSRAPGETVAGSPYAVTAATFAAPGGARGGNYNAGALDTSNTPTLSVTAVGGLTAQVTSQSKVYGNDDPAVAGVPVTLAGFVNRTVSTWNGGVPVNDSGVTTTAISLARDAGETVTAPGPAYAITGGTFNVPNTNYTAPSFDGANLPTLTITKATVGGQLTTPGQTKSYGADDPSIAGIAITATTGLVSTTVTDWNSNGTLIADTSANVTLTLASLSRAPGETVAGSPYAVTAATFAAPGGARGGNYNAGALDTSNTPTLSVTAVGGLTAQVTSTSKSYGTNDPAVAGVTVTLAGFVNRSVATWNGSVPVNDTGITTTASALARDPGELVAGSPYNITGGTFNAPNTNYTAPSFDGANSPTLSITKVTLNGQLTSPNQTKSYGADDPSIAGIAITPTTGLVNTSVTDWNSTVTPINDTGNVTLTLATLSRAPGETVAGSPYAVTAATFAAPGGAAAGNYNAGTVDTSNSPNLAITAVGGLTAQVTSTSKSYGTNDPAVAGVTVTLAGFVNRSVATWNGSVPVNDTGITTTASALARDPGELVAGSPYNITGGTFNAPNTNYTAPSFDGANSPTLSITKVTLNGQLTSPNQTKSYGADDPSIAGIAITPTTGLVNTSVTDWNSTVTPINDTGNVTLTLATLSRAPGETVAGSPYAVTAATFAAPGGAAAGNYNAGTVDTSNSPNLAITAVGGLTAQVTSTSKSYGTNDPAVAGVTVTLAGFVNRSVATWNGSVPVNDTGITTTASALARDPGELVAGSPYNITGGTFNAPNTNYTAPSFDGANSPTLSITKVTLNGQLTSPNQTKSYGADDPAIAGIAITPTTGLVNTSVTDWNSTVTPINDTGNVTLTLATLSRAPGETVAGSPYAVTAATFAAPGGAAAGNYNAGVLDTANTPNLAVTAVSVTGTITTPGQTKVYGTDDPALPAITTGTVVNRSVATWNGPVTVNDTGNVTLTLASLTRDPGEAVSGSPYNITAGTFNAPGGSAGGNYTAGALDTSNSPILSITKATVDGQLSSPNQTKSYGIDDPSIAGIAITPTTGVVNRTVSTWNGSVLVNDTGSVTLALASLTRAPGENVATSPYAITAATFAAPGGAAAGNYNAGVLDTANTPNLAVTAVTVNLDATRNYDGTVNFVAGSFVPVISGTVANTSFTDWNGNTTNVVGAQGLTIASGTGTVPSRDAGAPQLLTTGTLALGNGANGGIGTNYTLSGGTHSGTINQRPVTLTAPSVSKQYDGTLTYTTTPGDLTSIGGSGPLVGGDTVSSATIAYTNANAGAGTKTVTLGSTVISDGNGGNNYSLTQLGNSTSTITTAPLQISTTNVTKTYDGGLSALGTATVVGGTLYTNVSNSSTLDSISGGTFAYTNRNFGVGNKTVTTSAVAVSDGNGGNNYAVTYVNNTTSTINARAVTLTAPNVTKTYDGGLTYTTTAGDLTSLATSGPLVGGDSVTSATIAYTNKDVGAGNKTVTLSGTVINDGNGGANYVLTQAGNSTSTINQLGSVAWTGAGGNLLWSNAANWAGNAIPDLNNVASVNLSGATVTMNLAGVQSTSVSNGSLNLTTGSFTGPSLTATLGTYNQTGGSVATSGNISITTTGNLTPGTITSSLGSVGLTAAAILAGGTVSGASGTFSSGAPSVTGVAIDFQNKPLLLTGAASSWTLTGPATAPIFSVTASATNIFYNGSPVSGAAVVAIQQSGSVIASTLAEIARAALLETQDTDSVQKQMAYGFAGDVGTTPPMDHRIDETGISVPSCFSDSREGQTCR